MVRKKSITHYYAMNLPISTQLSKLFSVAIISLTAVLSLNANWETIDANFPDDIVSNGFERMATDGTYLYVLSENNGVYVSSDNGSSFSAVNTVSGASYDLSQFGFRFIEYANGYIWVGHDPGSAALNNGLATLHRLVPGTTTWEKASNGFPALTIANNAEDIAYDPINGTYVVASALGGAYTSSDGLNWSQHTTAGSIGNPTTVTTHNGALYLASPLDIVSKSTDQGATWNNTLSVTQASAGNIESVAGNLVVWANSSIPLTGHYVSDDDGANWYQVTGAPAADHLFTDGSLLLASGAGLYYSQTGGFSWAAVDLTGMSTPVYDCIMTSTHLIAHTSSGLYRRALSELSFPTTSVIVAQPVGNDKLVEGDDFSLSVKAAGATLSYQWRKDGVDIPGATSATLDLTDVVVADSGSYDVIVTASDGSTTSSAVSVTVVAREDGKDDPHLPEMTYPRVGGKVVVLPDGSFIELSGNYIMRGDDSGVLLDRDFSGLNYVNALLTSDEKLLIYGWTAPSIRLLDPYTLQDVAGFTSPNFTSGAPVTITETPGKGYIMFNNNGGSSLSAVDGVSINKIVLMNYDGSIDPAFDSTSFYLGGFYDALNFVEATGSGKIYAQGKFYISATTTLYSDHVIRVDLNGALDTSFTPASDYEVIASLSADRLLVWKGIPANGQLRILLPDGSEDPNFNVVQANMAGFTLAVEQLDGKILVAGDNFKTFMGNAIDGYARINADGTFDSGFYSATGFGSTSSYEVTNLAYDPRGYAYLSPESNSSSATFQTSGEKGLARVFTSQVDLGISFSSGDRRVDIGTDTTLKVAVVGDSPTYQWYKDGSPIGGATASTFDLTNFQVADAGTYYVEITNSAGTVTSRDMVLSAVGAPEITTQPVAIDGLLGDDYSLSVSATGAATLTYQWYEGTTAIPSATTTTLDFTNIQLSDQGTYHVVVSNHLGSATSDSVSIVVNEVTGILQTSFVPGSYNNQIKKLSVMPDGSVTIGGYFSYVGSNQHSYFTKLELDGSPSTGWDQALSPSGNGGANSYVLDVEQLSTGKVMLSGQFSTVAGLSRRGVVRMNADGSVDTTFDAGTATTSVTEAIGELPNGQYLIGGSFNSWSGVSGYGLARLNSDGSHDTSFNTFTNHYVFTIKVLPDGRTYVAGRFTQIGGVARSYIARLNADGTVDDSFVPHTFNNYIYDLDVQSDGKLIVGGFFTSINTGSANVSRYYAARLNSDGTLDESFNANIPASRYIYAVDVQLNGKIMLGGNSGYLQRHLPNGDADPYFILSHTPNNVIYDLETTPDGKLYICGGFSNLGGRNYVALLNTDSSDLAILQGPSSQLGDLNGSVTFTTSIHTATTATYQWYKDGQLINGETGSSLALTGLTREDGGNYQVVITNDTTSETSEIATLTVLAEPQILTQPASAEVPNGGSVTLEVQAVGAGSLSYQWRKDEVNLNGETANTLDLTALDYTDAGCYDVVITNSLGNTTSWPAGVAVYAVTGAIDPSFNIGTGANSSINDIETFANGNVMIVGNFSSVAGQTRTRAAIFDSSANLVPLTTNPAFSKAPYKIAAQSNGQFIIAGSRASTYYAVGLDRYNADGSLDGTYSGSSNWLQAVTANSTHSFAVGNASPSVVQANILATGALDTTYQTNHTSISTGYNCYSVYAQPDGKVLVGCQNYLFRLNADGTPDTGFTTATISGNVYAIVQDAAGGYWIGGSGTIGGKSYLARLNADGSLDTNVDVTEINGTVRDIFIVNNQVYAIGQFSGGMKRILADGSVDSTFDLGISATFTAGSVDSQGRLYAAGNFSATSNSITYEDIIRVVVSSDETLQIVCDPAGVSANEGDDTRLTVAWRGASAASYQWKKDGVDIDGATSQELLLENLTSGDAGSYTVVVTDASGSETSAAATVTVASGSSIDYAAWAAANLPGGVSDQPNADNNNNGIRDFLEFAFAITNGQRSQMPQHVIANGATLDAGADPTKAYLTLTYRVSRLATGITVTPKAATTLDQLQNGGSNVTQVSVTQDGDVDVYVYRTNWSIDSNDAGFLYLQVDGL